MLEMKNIRPSFELCEGDVEDLVGHQDIYYHIMFDIKLGDNVRRKARFVSVGHKTSAQPSTCCASIVSRESVRISLLDAALSTLDVLSCEIQNACLSAPCRDNVVE